MNDRIPIFLERPLPGLELELFPEHPHVVLAKNGKPKRTGETVPPMVRVSTFPGPVMTASPERLRRLARELQIAANVLDRAHAGQYPLTSARPILSTAMERAGDSRD